MKFTNKQMVEQALGNIETLVKHQDAIRAALHRARDMSYRDAEINAGTLCQTLIQLELSQWRNLFMFGLTLDEDERDRVKAAAAARFLSDQTHVGNYITNKYGEPTSFYTADEEEFRKMVKECFFKQGE